MKVTVGGTMKQNTRHITMLALFITIEIVIASIPFLGYIPLGVINATTLHIPVIAAGILLGKKEGAMVGFVFGLTSIIKNTLQPTATSFVFSPFYSIGNISGGWQSILIALLPRILIGFLAGWIYEIMQKKQMKDVIAMPISAMIGSLVNTILVMLGIYFFFGNEYATVMNIAYDAMIHFLAGMIAVNGVAEALCAAFIVTAICKAGKHVIKR